MSPVTYGAYGDGAVPIINGANLVTGMTQYSGNVYTKGSITTEPRQCFYNGALLNMHDGATTGVGVGEWDWASNTLYLNVGENPANGTVEISQRDLCIDIEYSNVTIDGLAAYKSNTNSLGGITVGNYGTSNIIIRNCDVAWNNNLGIFVWSGVGGDNQILNNKIHDNAHGFYAYQHTGASSGHECIFRGNEVYNNRGVVNSVNFNVEIYANYWIVEHNHVHDNGGNSDGIGIHIYTNPGETTCGHHNIVRYNLSYGQIANHLDGSGIELDYSTRYNQVYYNICHSNYGPGIDVYYNSYNEIYNNVCYNNLLNTNFVGHWGEIILAGEFGLPQHNNIYKNNIAYATQPDVVALYVDQYCYDQGNVFENNALYSPNNSNFYHWSTSGGNSITTFNGFTGCAKNINADPKMVDPANGNFHLQPESPCINKGVNVSLTQDYNGSTVPYGSSLPDIGAFEFIGDIGNEYRVH
jgi:parallel beta-helix repeat protein